MPHPGILLKTHQVWRNFQLAHNSTNPRGYPQLASDALPSASPPRGHPCTQNGLPGLQLDPTANSAIGLPCPSACLQIYLTVMPSSQLICRSTLHNSTCIAVMAVFHKQQLEGTTIHISESTPVTTYPQQMSAHNPHRDTLGTWFA